MIRAADLEDVLRFDPKVKRIEERTPVSVYRARKCKRSAFGWIGTEGVKKRAVARRKRTRKSLSGGKRAQKVGL